MAGSRAILTGALLGASLSLCNLYSGLKLGWSTSMGISGAILAHFVWGLRTKNARARSPFSSREAVVAATSAAGAAAVSSTGLVAGIPALALTTGHTLSWAPLAAWVFGVSFLGASIAAAVAGVLVADRSLAFPNAVAIRETVRQLDAPADGVRRARVMLVAAIGSGLVKVLGLAKLVRVVPFPGRWMGYPLSSLTWAFDPSLLLLGIGGLIGMRACASVLLGSVLAYLVGAPALLRHGLVATGDEAKSWFRDLSMWLLWPGVALMVVASLVTFVLASPRLLRSFRTLPGGGDDVPSFLPRRWLVAVLVLSCLLMLALLRGLFGVALLPSILGLAITAALLIVGARAQGEAGVTPVGPMARVTQLAAGVAAPGDLSANLMTATMTGGAISEGTELVTCLRAGHDLDASPRQQFLAHVVGSIAGAAAGAFGYLVLLPSPSSQLFTPEWPAPAVAQWKAVAEVLCRGLSALPRGAASWTCLAVVVSLVLTLAETAASPRTRRFLPSAASLGLGFVMPAQQSVSLFLGGVLAVLVARLVPKWSAAGWVVVCGGVIAGESLVGVIASALSLGR